MTKFIEPFNTFEKIMWCVIIICAVGVILAEVFRG